MLRSSSSLALTIKSVASSSRPCEVDKCGQARAKSDAGLLVIDAAEGVRDQTRRHIHLLQLLGISQLAVVINKMDRVGFDQGRFLELEAEIAGQLSNLGLSATAILPIAARHGDGVARHTPAIAWHKGPTLLEV